MANTHLLRRLAGLAFALLWTAAGIAASDSQSPEQIVRNLATAERAATEKNWPAVKAAAAPVTAASPLYGRAWLLLARAHYNTGDYANALSAYEQVLDLRQGLPSSAAYYSAVCHARLGHKDQALQWLQRAKDMGLRYVDDAMSEEGLAEVRKDPRFDTIFWPRDTSGLSRVQGWNRDIDVIASEVRRRAFHPFIERERDRIEWGTQFTSAGFDAAVAQLRRKVPTLSDSQVAVEIMKLMRQVGDGHTGAYPEGGPVALPLSLPLLTFDFADGHYVIATAPSQAQLLGARVIAVDGVPIEQVIERLEPIVSRDNPTWIRQVAPYRWRNTTLLRALGIGDHDTSATLTVERTAGKQETIRVAASKDDVNIWNTVPAPANWKLLEPFDPKTGLRALRRMSEHYWFEYLPERRVLYVQYNNVNDSPEGESLAQFSDRLAAFLRANAVDKVVLDMRWNNGGNTFVNEPLLRTLIRHEPLAERGRFVVLIGRRTFSAAMAATSYLERFLDPVFVGERTGGKPNSVGDEVWETLPYSGLQLNVSDIFWQTGWPFDHRLWIAPQIEVEPRFADLRAGRDRALEVALEVPVVPR
jgi:tetratricopeptide (TPR) repeat protein/C-terminal processing protease CtpA/Prc